MQTSVEALDIAVLPRRSRFNEGGAASQRGDPQPDGLDDEPSVRCRSGCSQGRHVDEQIGQHVDDVDREGLAPDPNLQALPGELVQHVEHAEGATVIGPVMHEVVGPDMVRPLGAQPDTRVPHLEPTEASVTITRMLGLIAI